MTVWFWDARDFVIGRVYVDAFATRVPRDFWPGGVNRCPLLLLGHRDKTWRPVRSVRVQCRCWGDWSLDVGALS